MITASFHNFNHMRKVILGVAVSLDSFIEGPNGEYDWCLMDQDYGMSDFMKRIDTLFMGRKTYEMSLAIGGHPAGFPKFDEYVFSTTLDSVKKDATLIKGDVRKEVEKIKNAEQTAVVANHPDIVFPRTNTPSSSLRRMPLCRRLHKAK